MLTTFAKFRPTSFDCSGVGANEADPNPDAPEGATQAEWLVCPVTRRPNIAEPIDESNWDAQREAISEADPEGLDTAVHYFGHWGTPFELVVVRPDTAAAACALNLAKRLADYPILNEDDLSERESDLQFESIENELARLTIEANGVLLSKDATATLAGEIASNASDSEMMDRDEVTASLTRLGYVECDDEIWRPIGETDAAPESLED